MTTETRHSTPADEPGTADEVLVSPQWLEAHLGDPRVRIVEVDVSRARYDERHIAGAVLWNVYQDLKDASYRLIDAEAIERLVVRSGISADSTVVFYGYAPAMGFWLMKLFRHLDARILNCSRDTWFNHGRPTISSAPELTAGRYQLGSENGRLRARHDVVANAIGNSGTTIVDVRSLAEYLGERFWPSGGLEPNGRAGHIPTAIRQPVEDLYAEDGSFLSAAELREVFAATDTNGANGANGASELITYCTIGGRACTAWFVLTYLLGRGGVRVYDGSWAEWGLMTGTPVEQ